MPRRSIALALAVRGGTTEDGTAVEGLPLDYGRVRSITGITDLPWREATAAQKRCRCSRRC